MKKLLIPTGLFLFPLVSFAQSQSLQGVGTGNAVLGYWEGLIANVGHFLNTLVLPLLIVLAVLMIFVGAIQYTRGEAGKGKEKGKGMMIQGIIALFIMVSLWGIIALLQQVSGVQGNTGTGSTQTAPAVPGV